MDNLYHKYTDLFRKAQKDVARPPRGEFYGIDFGYSGIKIYDLQERKNSINFALDKRKTENGKLTTNREQRVLARYAEVRRKKSLQSRINGKRKTENGKLILNFELVTK